MARKFRTSSLIVAAVMIAGCTAAPVTPAAPDRPRLVEATPPAAPAPGNRILIFGGGPNPHHSQASLEQNVLYFRRVLDILKLNSLRHDVYFTDGTSTGRTVQIRITPTADIQLHERVASIFGDDSNGVEMLFRAPQIANVAGPSTPEAIANYFTQTAKSLRPNDHLLVYFTGHGSPVRRPRPGAATNPAPTPGTQLETWNETNITTRDLVTQLDKLNPDVDVTCVMVQCYSGGFANMIYNEGDPAKGLSKAHRCGFFSTVSTRPAAGCTPDIEGDDYQEFSTSFFAALSGTTRAGKAIEKPDYDHNGVTSFTEAFTYVLLNSNTIDIPMTTSDQLLRDRARFGNANSTTLLTPNEPYNKVLSLASSSQKAALEGLSAQLELTSEDRIGAARKLATSIEQQRVALQRSTRETEQELVGVRNKIRQILAQRWPELAVRLHPEAEALLIKDAVAIRAAIESHANYAKWRQLRDKIDQANAEDMKLERKWVKAQRFIARAESVILAGNLRHSASSEIVQAFEELTRRENQTLQTWK